VATTRQHVYINLTFGLLFYHNSHPKPAGPKKCFRQTYPKLDAEVRFRLFFNLFSNTLFCQLLNIFHKTMQGVKILPDLPDILWPLDFGLVAFFSSIISRTFLKFFVDSWIFSLDFKFVFLFTQKFSRVITE
jgi:hypothetical protein